MLTIFNVNDLYHILNLFLALVVSLFFGIERSYRGKTRGLLIYSIVTTTFAGVAIAMQYLESTPDVFTVSLLFLALVLVVFLIHLWQKDNMEDISSASLIMSSAIGILIALKLHWIAFALFVIAGLIYSLIYLLCIYIERRKYALTIIVPEQENILLKVLNVCDELGAKIDSFKSSIILIEGESALRLEVLFEYGTPKKKVRKVFDSLKSESIINLIFHGDIHKMEWR